MAKKKSKSKSRTRSKTTTDSRRSTKGQKKATSKQRTLSGQLAVESVSNEERELFTGRQIVIFKENALDVKENESLLRRVAGVKEIAKSSDYESGSISAVDIEDSGGGYFTNMGIAVLAADTDPFDLFASISDVDSPILTIESEYYAYHQSVSEKLVSIPYLNGYRDAINDLVDKITNDSPTQQVSQAAVPQVFQDDDDFTWGLRAIGVDSTRYTGAGCRVAVLDTGIDLNHPDFDGRAIVSDSFSGETVQDVHGHGTHCCGTACGPSNPASGVRRYGVAPDAELFVGKVFNNVPSPLGPRAATGDVVAGIEWAMRNRCQVVSLSLGVAVDRQIAQYRIPIRRALSSGTLVIAAAGNNANRPGQPEFKPGRPATNGFVEPPANADDSMAVAAVNRELRLAAFSARSSTTTAPGGNVDITGPGVSVFSSVAGGRLHTSLNGTSMATPHVAGVAALIHEATGETGRSLWNKLLATARPLAIDRQDSGVGLVQAP